MQTLMLLYTSLKNIIFSQYETKNDNLKCTFKKIINIYSASLL